MGVITFCSLIILPSFPSVCLCHQKSDKFHKTDNKVIAFINKGRKHCSGRNSYGCYDLEHAKKRKSLDKIKFESVLNIVDIMNLECDIDAEFRYKDTINRKSTSVIGVTDAQIFLSYAKDYGILYKDIVKSVLFGKKKIDEAKLEEYLIHAQNVLELKKVSHNAKKCSTKSSMYAKKLIKQGVNIDERNLLSRFQTKDFCYDLQQMEGPGGRKTANLNASEIRKDCFYLRKELKVVEKTSRGVIALVSDFDLEKDIMLKKLVFVSCNSKNLSIDQTFDGILKYTGYYQYYLPNGTKIIPSFIMIDVSQYPYFFTFVKPEYAD
ncbi:MAG: hypothetical protein JJW01_02120 [Alphaproteobacteria bacterium]|nr:hypothetical protein [Rickettsiales bacterium]